jgi:nucleoside-diphosphate-sugar epimerase
VAKGGRAGVRTLQGPRKPNPEWKAEMTVLIAGCGYVGTELGLRLSEAGVDVVGLRRNAGHLPAALRPLSADLAEPDLADRLPPVESVVYAASAGASTEEAYRRAYVEGVGNLLRALTLRGMDVRRFVFVSSTAVYGEMDGGWVDEDTPPSPGGFRGEVMLEGERLVGQCPFPSTVLRLGGIYGPGRTRLMDRVRAGEAVCPGGGPLYSNRIHRDDAALALAHLLDLRDPAPTYLGVDGEPTPVCEVYRFLAGLLGAPEPRVDPSATRDRSNKRCSNRRLRGTGFRFRYPSFREGYRAVVAAGG